MKNTGREYEDFIEYYYKELSRISRQEVSVYKDAIVKGKTGEHQIDVTYEFDYLNERHRVLLECKDYSRNVDYPTVRSFVAAALDVPAAGYIMFSPRGFSENPRMYAERNGVKCVSMGEMQGTLDLIKHRLEKIIIPNPNTIGEPFWSIGNSDEMFTEMRDFGHGPCIPISFRRSDCEKLASILSTQEGRRIFAYGVRQENLGLLVRLARLKNIKFTIISVEDVYDESDSNSGGGLIRVPIEARDLTPEEIEGNFLILGHV